MSTQDACAEKQFPDHAPGANQKALSSVLQAARDPAGLTSAKGSRNPEDDTTDLEAPVIAPRGSAYFVPPLDKCKASLSFSLGVSCPVVSSGQEIGKNLWKKPTAPRSWQHKGTETRRHHCIVGSKGVQQTPQQRGAVGLRSPWRAPVPGERS